MRTFIEKRLRPFHIIGLMQHSLAGLKAQKSMKNCTFLKTGILRLIAHQIIGLKPINNKFRCFREVQLDPDPGQSDGQ